MRVVCDLDIISQKLLHARGLAGTPNEISTSTGAGSLSFFVALQLCLYCSIKCLATGASAVDTVVII